MMLCPFVEYLAFFADLCTELRNVCMQNPNMAPKIHGAGKQFHTFTWDAMGNKDRYKNGLYCDMQPDGQCCPLTKPKICVVDQFDTLPGYTAVNYWNPLRNPWYNTYQFVDVQTALRHCQAKVNSAGFYTIVITGNQNFWGLPATAVFKTYDIRFDYLIGPRLLPHFDNATNTTVYNETYDNVILQGAPGMVIRNTAATSHYVNMSGVRATILSMPFQHACGLVPTWKQPTWASSYRLTIDSCVFDGDQNDARPFDGIYDNKFVLSNTFITNYTGLVGARFYGRACNGVDTIGVTSNAFSLFVGTALEVLQWANFRVNHNTFSEVGGNTPDRWYAVMMSICGDALTGLMQAIGNHLTTTQTQTSTTGRWTAYVFDPVPDIKSKQIQENTAELLEVGIRLMNYPNNPPTANPKQRLIIWYTSNSRAKGSWHYVVEGPPVNDPLIDADPKGTKKHYCDPDNCVPYNWEYVILAAIAALGLIAACALCYALCCLQTRSMELYHSDYFNIDVPVQARQRGEYFNIDSQRFAPDPRRPDYLVQEPPAASESALSAIQLQRQVTPPVWQATSGYQPVRNPALSVQSELSASDAAREDAPMFATATGHAAKRKLRK